MDEYRRFVSRLSYLFSNAATNVSWRPDAISSALDGQAKAALEDLPDLARRDDGVFFTGSELARKAARHLESTIRSGGTICDPACGAGDLLLACGQYLPVASSLRATIKSWTSSLRGRELHGEFVRAAKLRLALLAVVRSQRSIRRVPPVRELFSQIRRGSGLVASEHTSSCDGYILNPPFNTTTAPNHVTWGQGGVNNSAIFLERCISYAGPGAKIVAILPDVLRSGARYAKWRACISQLAEIDHIELLEQFDDRTDVHVFLLVLRKRLKTSESVSEWDYLNSAASSSVGDFFQVSIGPVVDCRDAHLGPWHPFVVARNLERWTTVYNEAQSRRFLGTLVKAPFVVIRRTSRPGDIPRAVGTIVGGQRKWAVENHLIVAKPKDARVKTCKTLLELLRSHNTTSWLDRKIRCRHLTISSIRGIPWEK